MKFLKSLAVAYLILAIVYSVVSAQSWIGDALAFKLNGGPQLVAQLNGDSFSFFNVQVDSENRLLGLSLREKLQMDG